MIIPGNYIFSQVKQHTAMCEAMQNLEEDRIQFVRNSVWSLANIGSETCVKVDDSRYVDAFILYNSPYFPLLRRAR